MNKKFSTLLASALLATTVGASAQTPLLGAQHYTFRSQDVMSAVPSTVGVKEIKSDLLYQLSDGTNVLIQKRNPQTGEVTMAMVDPASAPLNASLWQIKFDADDASGKNFTFVNKETNLEIVFNSANAEVKTTDDDATSNATVLDGCIEKWAWYVSDETQAASFPASPIYSAYTSEGKDYVLVLQAKTNGDVVAVSYPKSVVGASISSITSALDLKPVIAGGKVLSANELNSMVDFQEVISGKTAVKFNMNPLTMIGAVAQEDTLTKYSYKAINYSAMETYVPGFSYTLEPTTSLVAFEKVVKGTSGVYASTAPRSFFMVDTAFYNEGDPALVPLKVAVKPYAGDLKVSDQSAGSQRMTNVNLSARYLFEVTYYPTNDSLDIRVSKGGALKMSKADVELGKAWVDGTNNTSDWEPNSYTESITNNNAVVRMHYLDRMLPHTVLTVGAPTINPANPDGTIFTKINFKDRNFKYLERATVAEGLYHIKEVNTEKFVVANMDGNYQYDVPEDKIQDYNDMPATMWVVKKVGCGDAATVAVYNREYINKNAAGDTIPAFEGQLYKDDKGLFILNLNYDDLTAKELVNTDDYSFVSVTDEDALNSEFHGYKNFNPETLKYTKYYMNYNLAEMDDLYLNVTKDGFFARSEGNVTSYELDTVDVRDAANIKNVKFNEFGFGKGINGLKQLKRNAYTVKVSDVNLIDNDTTYIALVKEAGRNEYYKAMGIKDIRAGKGQLAFFYLKADQVKDIADPKSEKCYVLVDVNDGTTTLKLDNGAVQAHCVDGVERLSYVSLDNEPTERASAFAFTVDNRPLYMSDLAYQNINIFRERGSEKLFEDNANQSNSPSVVEGFGYLGLTAEGITPGEGYTTAMYVDSVIKSNVRMPQYMFVLEPDSVADGFWCVSGTHGYFASKEEADAADKNHNIFYNGYVAGRFLVNLTDSITDGTNMLHNADKYKYQSYTRLGFVEGVHMNVTADEAKEAGFDLKEGEYFFTLKAGKTLADLKNEQGYIIPEKLKDNTNVNVLDGAHKNYAFSLRYTDDEHANFLLESNLKGVSKIGSYQGAWVKIHNGVPVLAQFSNNSGNHESAGSISEVINQSQIFKLEATEDAATDNETVTASTISVVATNGAVIVKGAEGKKVAISNVLGQAIANTVITSSEATIAVPAGVVVVAVEGEAAVKAIVK